MTDPNYTHYLLVIDRSGSMHSTKDDATGGIRQFTRDQAALLEPPRYATLSLYQFDHEQEKVHDFAWLSPELGYELVPRGMTRLLDAVGAAVTETGERLASMPEDQRPGRVAVLIVTDGQENDSREWSLGRVRALVTQQAETYGWAFTYIGSSPETFEDAGTLGIPAESTLNYSASGLGTRNAYKVSSASVGAYASGQSCSVSYDSAQRETAMEDGE